MEARSQFPGEQAVTFNPIIIEGGRQQIGLELGKLARAGGFHHMLGSARDRRLFSVEASPTQCTIQEISKGYAHANHLLHPGTARPR